MDTVFLHRELPVNGVEVKKNLWPVIRANLRLTDKSHVAVGFPGNKAKTQKMHGDSGMTVGQVAIANEMGSGPGVKPIVPARPFVAETVRLHGDGFQKLSTDLLGMISGGKMSTRIALGRMGKNGVDKMQDTIVQSETWATENAKSTKAKKRSSTPLIDTKTMVNSITYDVRMKGTKAP